jgi:heat shock protein HtpX
MLALIAIAIVIAVVAHVLALVLRMALSRSREYLADAGAVEMTGDPDAMISALRKVAQRSGLAAVPEQVRALFLHDAKLSSGMTGWFATHPPIDDRVAALVRYAGGHDPGKLPELAEEAPAETEPELAEDGPRSPIEERMDAIAAFARTNDSSFMQNQAKREKARRSGLDPDTAAPPPPPFEGGPAATAAPPWADPVSAPGAPSAGAPHSPASSPPANPWRPRPPGQPGPG